MKKMLVFAGLTITLILTGILTTFAWDTPNTIIGTPISAWTSNTAVLYEFLTARSVLNLGDEEDYLTITTLDQTVDDGTSVATLRRPLRQWLDITNLTTRTLYIALNAGLQRVATGNAQSYINETTPTLSNVPGKWEFRLDPYTSALPYRLEINAVDAPWLFAPAGGIWNVGIYLNDASTDFVTSAALQVEITTNTLILKGR